MMPTSQLRFNHSFCFSILRWSLETPFKYVQDGLMIIKPRRTEKQLTWPLSSTLLKIYLISSLWMLFGTSTATHSLQICPVPFSFLFFIRNMFKTSKDSAQSELRILHGSNTFIIKKGQYNILHCTIMVSFLFISIALLFWSCPNIASCFTVAVSTNPNGFKVFIIYGIAPNNLLCQGTAWLPFQMLFCPVHCCSTYCFTDVYIDISFSFYCSTASYRIETTSFLWWPIIFQVEFWSPQP